MGPLKAVTRSSVSRSVTQAGIRWKVPLNSLQWDFLLVVTIKNWLPRNGLIKAPELLSCVVLRKNYRLRRAAAWDEIPTSATAGHGTAGLSAVLWVVGPV